jgi:hypothetical protein
MSLRLKDYLLILYIHSETFLIQSTLGVPVSMEMARLSIFGAYKTASKISDHDLIVQIAD